MVFGMTKGVDEIEDELGVQNPSLAMAWNPQPKSAFIASSARPVLFSLFWSLPFNERGALLFVPAMNPGTTPGLSGEFCKFPEPRRHVTDGEIPWRSPRFAALRFPTGVGW